jgi:hypothetical protein
LTAKHLIRGTPSTNATEPRCSFCDKAQGAVDKLIAGPAVHICGDCVQTCVEIMADDAQAARYRDPSEGAASREPNDSGQSLDVACALCGTRTQLDEAMPIAEHGFLCPDCVNAVESAIAARSPEQ